MQSVFAEIRVPERGATHSAQTYTTNRRQYRYAKQHSPTYHTPYNSIPVNIEEYTPKRPGKRHTTGKPPKHPTCIKPYKQKKQNNRYRNLLINQSFYKQLFNFYFQQLKLWKLKSL